MQLHAQQANPYALPQQQQQPTTAEVLLFDFEKANINDGHDNNINNDRSLLADESEEEGLALIDVELDDDSVGKDGARTLEDRRRDGDFLGGGDVLRGGGARKADANADADGGGGPSPKVGGGNGGGRGRQQRQPRQGRGGQQQRSWDRNPDLAPPPPRNPSHRLSEFLATNAAPAMSSPLPKHELVHHAGYVLSRISFRTVLMRKWKQTFWIQYGPCILLFFRSFSDYDDWLNNPYHTIKAREFLVKLRVDFVGDLKKASVMGYQVTQIRRKPYGRNTM
jgi:hypothetical protein